MSYTRSFLSFDDRGFDLPTEQREFNRKLAVLEVGASRFKKASAVRDLLRNAAVGGNPYSQHLLGLAADYQLEDVSPAAVQAFMQRARAAGLVPVDETRKTRGTGPHVHVQAYPAGTIPKRIYTQIGVQIREDP